MKTWMIAGALILAGVMLTGPALAQGTSSGAGKEKATNGGTSSDTMKSDTGKSGAMKSSAKSGAAHMGASREQVKEAQQALKDKGHDPGTIDGVMGPKTQAAIKDFQSKEGLKESGRLDSETLAKLGVQAKAGASESSPSASPGAGSTSGTTTPGGSSSSGAGSTSGSSSSGSSGSTK